MKILHLREIFILLFIISLFSVRGYFVQDLAFCNKNLPADLCYAKIAEDIKSAGAVNINTASSYELRKLKGIGEVIASRIVLYREKKGSFRCCEDLLNVKGIGPKKLEAIREDILF